MGCYELCMKGSCHFASDTHTKTYGNGSIQNFFKDFKFMFTENSFEKFLITDFFKAFDYLIHS